MKKIKKIIFTFIFMLVCFFVFQNNMVLAADTTDLNDELIVINPNSSNEPNYKIDDVQYTRSRDITIKTLIDDETLETYDTRFRICEHIPADSADNIREQERCSYYLTSSKENSFQLVGRNDGEKTLNIYFYSNYATQTKVKTVTKKIVLDTTGPIITLTNGEYVFVPQGERYEEPGATCLDDSGVVSEECYVEIEEASIDMNQEGYQYIRYTATDFLGNEVNVVRKVMVEIKKEKSNNTYWYLAIGGIVVLALALGYVVIKNKEKQKNQSVL